MFITFEGIDGSGKSTQISLLEPWLAAQGYEVVILREPGGTPLSEAVRGVLLSSKNEIHPRAELLLFEAARAQLTGTVIRPALQRRAVILCDRFADSSTAYQGYGRGLPVADIIQSNEVATAGLQPDITFLLDIPVEVALGRAQARRNGTPDRMERSGEEFFRRVRQGYRELAVASPDRFVVLDAARPVGEIHAHVCRVIAEFFSRAGQSA